MTILNIGANVDRRPGPKYCEALGFAEISFNGPPPKDNTLRRWRSELPDGFKLSLVAPFAAIHKSDGALLRGEELSERTQWLTSAARALNADFVVVQTSSKVTPGQRDRQRLLRVFESVGSKKYALHWQPSGLWEIRSALHFTKDLNVDIACDPLQGDVPPGSVSYARLKAIGGRSRFGEGVLYDIADKLSYLAAAEAQVAIESEQSFREARRLQEIASEAGLTLG